MFGSSRKNRQAPQPLTNETANPNAATAAASAFGTRPSSSSLSSAAAAAALKARPMTPTNVAEVQSKRSVRRTGSISSIGSRGTSRDRGQSRELRRTPSNGSMTDRSFRSPSPGRSPAPIPHDAPPVPSLPKDTAQYQGKRSSSSYKSTGMNLSTQPLRTASQKMKDGQGSWFGGAAAHEGASPRRADSVLYSSSGPDGRPGSANSSINFSYPRASLEIPTSGDQALIYDPNSRRMVPKADLMARSQSVREASEKPVKKKKSLISRSGSHLAKGNVDRTKVNVPAKTQAPAPAPAPAAPQPEPQVSREPARTDVQETPKTNLAAAAGAAALGTSSSPQPALNKKPSVVREEPDSGTEDDAEDVEAEQQHGAIDTVPVPTASDVNETTTDPETRIDTTPEPPMAEGSQTGSVRRARVHSESPARSAHFAPTTDQLVVRHEPPPRSLSPRKSALKHSSGARGASPSDDSSEASGPRGSSNSKDEAARKKSFRVSFNDESNVVVGEAAEPPEIDSPIVPSPQATKKPWHSILSRRKKDDSPVDDDETMTPRPALPSFGSMREKKPREADSNERPLVRPTERAWSPPLVSSPLRQAGTSSTDFEYEGVSTDASIGNALAQESSSRNEANISRTREPLPPVVQSIEGSGYDSSSIMTTDDEMDDSNIAETSEPTKGGSSGAADAIDEEAGKSEETIKAPIQDETEAGVDSTMQNKSEGIPSISISANTPEARESTEISPEKEYFDVPGGFPGEDASPPSGPAPAPATATAPAIDTSSQVTHSTATEPTEIDESETSYLSEEPVASPAAPMADIPEEGTDDSSIYSDAYEDISDTDGAGFMSLDAVLTAPSDKKAIKTYEKIKRQSQEWAASTEALGSSDKAKGKEAAESDEHAQDDWENAKAYWRSLSTDKRRQLEMEALAEAGEEADYETEKKQKKKTKKRRSADRPVSGISTTSTAESAVEVQPAIAATVAEPVEPAPEPAKKKQTAASKAAAAAPQAIAPVAAPKFRKSMRGEQPKPKVETQQQPGGMRKTLRGNDAAPARPSTARPSTARPVSYHPSTPESQKTLRRAMSSERPASSGGLPKSTMRPSMRRQNSDDSDSSFKRTRAGGQGFGFRSSMRASSQEPESPAATKGSGRFSLRSLSPTGSTFRRGSFSGSPAQPPMQATSGSMRTTMRSSLRPGQTKEKRSSKMGFGRVTGGKGKGKAGTRFADSSDEEDGGGGGGNFFSSRFADSSDEEDAPAPAAKGGGFARSTMRSGRAPAPRPTSSRGATASPDIPDTEIIIPPKRNTISNTNGAVNTNGRPATLQRNRSGRGTIQTPAAPGVLGTDGVGGERPPQPRRNSFMSSILRRKKDDGGKISRDQSESLARRDTKLERSNDELNNLRTNSTEHARLHKREPSWPLPDEEDTGDDEPTVAPTPARPATSAGPSAAAASKPNFVKRRSISHQGVIQNQGVVSTISAAEQPEGPKKKKFGTLRKMFGLGD